jgi:hypothetical protein
VKFAEVGTKFGLAIVCTLHDGDNGHIDVFLPKKITESVEEIKSYNQRSVKDHLHLMYKGKLGRAFDVEFSK